VISVSGNTELPPNCLQDGLRKIEKTNEKKKTTQQRKEKRKDKRKIEKIEKNKNKKIGNCRYTKNNIISRKK
jgi:hypothetical protein